MTNENLPGFYDRGIRDRFNYPALAERYFDDMKAEIGAFPERWHTHRAKISINGKIAPDKLDKARNFVSSNMLTENLPFQLLQYVLYVGIVLPADDKEYGYLYIVTSGIDSDAYLTLAQANDIYAHISLVLKLSIATWFDTNHIMETQTGKHPLSIDGMIYSYPKLSLPFILEKWGYTPEPDSLLEFISGWIKDGNERNPSYRHTR